MLLAVGLAVLPAAALAYTPGAVTGGATVRGVVKFTGAVPAPVKLDIVKDNEVCGAEPKYDESLQVGAGQGLANVVVFIDKIDKGKPLAPGKAELDNHKCRFVPHLQAFSVGTELAVKNSDGVLHNTHIRLPNSDVFNYALPEKGQVIKKKVSRAGLMKVGCDAGHVWMGAWIAVFDHPYFAVTDKDGKFSLADVPPGQYNLMFWHEKLGKGSQKVTVQPGAAQDLTHVYK
ncbi:MAG: hypothetical protein HY902_01290 [Deltaproteobacteria bacterium]|nr:hypothetical protein [Deltaproteobacteria bacterium]